MENDQREIDNIYMSPIGQNKTRKNEIDKKFKNLQIDKTFVDSAIKAINIKRGYHGTKSLEFDVYLNKRAFILAKEYLTKGEIDNENLLYKNSEDLGMNLKMSDRKLEPEELVENWYEENKDYNYQDPKELNCNNFTQMIWKNSAKFGIGYYHLNEDEPNQKNQNRYFDINSIEENNQKEYEFCYIALFYPAGNIIGEYKNNVLELFINNFFVFTEVDQLKEQMEKEGFDTKKSNKKGKQNERGKSIWDMLDEPDNNQKKERKDLNINEIGEDKHNKNEIYNINEIEEEKQKEKKNYNINEIKEGKEEKEKINQIRKENCNINEINENIINK